MQRGSSNFRNINPNITVNPTTEQLQSRPYTVFPPFRGNFTQFIEYHVKGQRFENSDFSFANLSCMVFENCSFVNVSFRYAYMFCIQFMQCTFENCDFLGAYGRYFYEDPSLPEFPQAPGLILPKNAHHYWPIHYHIMKESEVIFSHCLRSDSIQHFSMNSTLNYSCPHYLEDLIQQMETYRQTQMKELCVH